VAIPLAGVEDTSHQRAVRWGTTIKHCRMAKKLTQEAFGKLVGVGQGTVANWEAGRWAPRDEHKARMAGLCSLDVALMFPIDRVDPVDLGEKS
jgi:transcriptional regulator with XRE-family HTH domain